MTAAAPPLRPAAAALDLGVVALLTAVVLVAPVALRIGLKTEIQHQLRRSC